MPFHEDESPKERVDRELGEMLQELRVALPGVQLLFGFLLIVPFSKGWAGVDRLDTHVYFAAVLLTAVSTALLIAPTAHHRMRFRDPVKEQLLRVATGFTIGGLSTLVAAMAAALFLVADTVYDNRVVAALAGLLGLSIGLLWFLAPMLYREHDAS